jgi:hypothetical protein
LGLDNNFGTFGREDMDLEAMLMELQQKVQKKDE